MDNDRAPWPIIVGLAIFTAAAVAMALQTTYDAAAAFIWITAAGSGWLAAHLTAEHIIHRIRTAGEKA